MRYWDSTQCGVGWGGLGWGRWWEQLGWVVPSSGGFYFWVVEGWVGVCWAGLVWVGCVALSCGSDK